MTRSSSLVVRTELPKLVNYSLNVPTLYWFPGHFYLRVFALITGDSYTACISLQYWRQRFACVPPLLNILEELFFQSVHLQYTLLCTHTHSHSYIVDP